MIPNFIGETMGSRPTTPAMDKTPSSEVNAVEAAKNDGRRELKEADAPQALGFAFPTWKKWAILTSVFIVQISMNFNAAIYGNAGEGMVKEFGVSMSDVKIGQMLFLVMYAFGCGMFPVFNPYSRQSGANIHLEAWAPWSEELGRKWVLQGSLFLVNVWAMACYFSPSFNYIMAFRALGGLSSAGGSVTLGMVADMWGPNEQQ